MYRLEVYKGLELIKTIRFTVWEGLEMLQYKQGCQSRGYTVQVLKVIG